MENRGEKTAVMAPGEPTNAKFEVSTMAVNPDNPKFGPWMIVARRGNYRGNKRRPDANEPY